jgi:hypothetical protein
MGFVVSGQRSVVGRADDSRPWVSGRVEMKNAAALVRSKSSISQLSKDFILDNHHAEEGGFAHADDPGSFRCRAGGGPSA